MRRGGPPGLSIAAVSRQTGIPVTTLRFYERYEFNENHSQETEVTLSKAFECVIVDATYNHRRGDGDSFFFVVHLKGYPSASFNLSQTYNRPKPYERGAF